MADLTLVLEASTPSASVALVELGVASAWASVEMRAREGERLLPAVVELLRASGRTTTELSRIVCSGGPGGFTGLRIAAAIGKGLAESLGVPLYRVSPLALLAAGDAVRTMQAGNAGSLDRSAARPVLAVLDAMREEWYVQHFEWELEAATIDERPALVAASAVDRLTRSAIDVLAARTGGTVVGVGGASFVGGREATPHARDLPMLPEGAFYARVDLAQWEPDYGRLAEAQVKWEAKHGRALGQGA